MKIIHVTNIIDIEVLALSKTSNSNSVVSPNYVVPCNSVVEETSTNGGTNSIYGGPQEQGLEDLLMWPLEVLYKPQQGPQKQLERD